MRGRQSGQALVELAASSVVLILLLFGVVDFARVYNADTALQAAAREGARAAITFDGGGNANPDLNDAAIQPIVDNALQGAGLPATGKVIDACNGTGPQHNPPFPETDFPPAGTTGTPYLVICYGTAGGGLPATECNPTCGGFDIAVAVVMRYPPVISGPVGPSVELLGYAHMRVQGS